ncbi:MAG: TonB-dependent receptor plug domain-containing protein [Gemmatimonadaceae bacterium]
MTPRRWIVPLVGLSALWSWAPHLGAQTTDTARLAGVQVQAEMPHVARLEAFERRRKAGTPSAVVMQAEIERVAPIVLSRMLRGVAGIQIGDSLGYTVAISRRGAKPSPIRSGVGFGLAQCVMRVMLDGVVMPALYNIDQVVPRDVYAVEVYNGPARLPPELSGLRTDTWCGLVAIWTREG